MYKRELRKLRALNATREMMEKAKRYETVKDVSKTYGQGAYKRTYTYRTYREYGLYVRLQTLNGFIKVAFFDPKKMIQGINTAVYELFINVKGDEYITRQLDDSGKEVAWRTGMLTSLSMIDIYNYEGYGYSKGYSRKGVYCNPEGTKTIKKALKKSVGNVTDMILDWQRDVRARDIAKQEAKQQAPWDEDMKPIGQIGQKAKEWASKEAVREHFMIYRHNTDETAYCTHCGKWVPVKEKLSHLTNTSCPRCKMSVKCICSGRRERGNTDWYSFEMLDRYPGGFVVRTAQIRNNLNFEKPEKSGYAVYEYARYIFSVDNEKNTWEEEKEYGFENWKQKKERWVRQDDKTAQRRSGWSYSITHNYQRPFSYFREHKIYKGNLANLRLLLPKRSAVEKMIRHSESLNIVKYLRTEKGNPAVEMLVKLDMFRLATEIMGCAYDNKLLNESETEIAKLLRIDNARLKRLKELDGGIVALKWLQLEKAKDTVFPTDSIRYFHEARLSPDSFDFISDRMSMLQISNYMRKQEKILNDKPDQTLRTWEDYINMAKKLKYDLQLEQNYKPSDLCAAHAACIEIIERGGMEKTAKEIRKKFKNVDKVLPTLAKYELVGKEYAIVAPKDVFDIVREGTILKHCVHTCDYYFDRISRRESYLLFLRRAQSPETPWYTLEVEPGGNIRQKRTTGDNQNEDFKNALGFLKQWQKEIQKRLSKEDKKLAEAADEERKKNYAELRAKGNRIWHGKLQGQLLADVLEKDFMQAV